MHDIKIDPFTNPCDVRELAKRVDWRTPLETIPYYAGLNVRLAMVANALSVLGLQAEDLTQRAVFDELLGPPYKWPLDKPYGRGGISTCSMVALGVLRRLGLDCEPIMRGYQIGTGMRVAHAYAHPRGAFVAPLLYRMPLPGDIIDLCPYPNSADKSNHTEIVLGFDGFGQTLVSVSGGQVGLGRLQAISITRRPWRMGPVEGTMAGQRRVWGWVDVEKLDYVGPVTVPEGTIPHQD